MLFCYGFTEEWCSCCFVMGSLRSGVHVVLLWVDRGVVFMLCYGFTEEWCSCCFVMG